MIGSRAWYLVEKVGVGELLDNGARNTFLRELER